MCAAGLGTSGATYRTESPVSFQSLPLATGIRSYRPGSKNTKPNALSRQWESPGPARLSEHQANTLSRQWEPLGPDPSPEQKFPLLWSWPHSFGSWRHILPYGRSQILEVVPLVNCQPPAKDNMVILVLVDSFSKTCKFMPLPKLSSAKPGTANTKQDALSIQWEPLGPDPFPEPTLFPLLGSWLHSFGSLRLIMEALRQEPDSGGRRPGLPPAKDNMVILVLVDCFSKACKFMPLPKLSSAKETVELLFSTWSGFTGR
ncbi:hypothetical protein AOLI_G00196390 [Acnodon oligacanthus]